MEMSTSADLTSVSGGKKNTLEYTYLCKQETGQSRSADCTSSVVAKVVTFCVEIEVSKRKVM